MSDNRELTYEGGGLKVRLVLGAATVLAGMKRALLQGRAQAYSDLVGAESGAGGSVEATARTLLARFLYPDLLACVVEAEGLNVEMSVAEFLVLPEALTDAWQNLVYALNPHWYPFQRPDEAEKNAATPRSDSAADS